MAAQDETDIASIRARLKELEAKRSALTEQLERLLSQTRLGDSLNVMRAQSALVSSLIGQRDKALCQLSHQIALFFILDPGAGEAT